MLQTYKVHQIDAIADMPDYVLYFSTRYHPRCPLRK